MQNNNNNQLLDINAAQMASFAALEKFSKKVLSE